jgi:hypothetical protein
VTPCSLVDVHRYFGGKNYLHLHDQRVRTIKQQVECLPGLVLIPAELCQISVRGDSVTVQMIVSSLRTLIPTQIKLCGL